MIQNNLKKIESVCRKRYAVKLYSFGSVNTGKFNEESDVDFLVEFSGIPIEDYADNYLDMCYDYEEILKRKVDLVTTRSVKNPYFKKEVELTRQLIFEA